MIRRLFTPPVFEKEEDNFKAKFINGFAWAVVILLTIRMISYFFQEAKDYTMVIIPGLIIVLLVALYLLHQGEINNSALLIIVLGWIGLGIQAATADGVKDVIIVAYIALGLLASIIMNWWAGSIVIASSIAAIWILAYMENQGIIAPITQGPVGYSFDLSLIFTAIAFLIYFSTTSLRDAITRANQSEDVLRKTNKELQELNQSLEERVSRRTAELELANQRNQNRAQQFEAIAQVARAIAANEKIDDLLPRLTILISDQFGFYHTGIFLLDDARENAVLRAANSDGGRRMLNRKHQLRVGQAGMVGFVSATGTPRIALDVGADAVFFDNPDLPNTRSEMALPLITSGELIGVLDIQSTEANAFRQEDISTLSTLADQVAIAIQNARTYEINTRLLQEAQQASGLYLRETWKLLESQEAVIGVHATGDEVQPLASPLSSEHVKKALANRQTVVEDGSSPTLAIPIRLRDEVIGVMDIRNSAEHIWEQDEVDIVEAVADRLSLAIESSLLLRSTQKRAELERITADISGKIGASTQFDAILRAAAEELSYALGGSDVLVQIQTDEWLRSVDGEENNS